MEPVNLDDVELEPVGGATEWAELLRVEALSVGRYVVRAGGPDPQEPHAEDEVYYVLDGVGRLRIGDEVHPVEPGDLVHVGRGVDHAFVDVEADLDLLVVFAPAEGSLAEGG